jgi:hypothetical protein
VEHWTPRRGSAFAPGFGEKLTQAVGVDAYWVWDHMISDGIERTLCGAERELLDDVYPPRFDGLRLALTEPSRGLPGLRIAFYVDDSDDEKIVYVSVVRRA